MSGSAGRREAGRTPESRVEAFNRQWPAGTAALYTSSPRTCTMATHTRSEAWVLGGHTPVVLVEGVSGAVALDALVMIMEESALRAGRPARRATVAERELFRVEVVAIWLWGGEYARSGLSAIEWYRNLAPFQKNLVADFMRQYEAAASREGAPE